MRFPFALVALLGSFALAGAQPPKPDAATAATVNGEPIALADVDAVLKHTLPLSPLNTAQRRQMRLEVLSDLVDDVLLRQFLRKNGPKVDPAEIDAQLKAYTEKLKTEGKTLAEWLRATGQTEAQVREAWTTAMQLTGYVKGVATEEQLKAYFTANRDHFDRVEVKVRHVMIRGGRTAVERAAAKEKATALRADLAAGKLDFATAAKKFSQCPSAPAGGDLGYILRKGGSMEESFAKAAFALKTNELSAVVETEFGFHVLQVTDRKPGTPTTYEKSATDVLDTYADEYRAELIAKLRKQGQIVVSLP
jgi:peptidyl-prolyl cis-trans isomerase C